MIHKKIISRSQCAELCAAFRSRGSTIGFTSGVFDILHAGHVNYLEKAKTLVDVLIVGVNSDSSVREYKGEARPVVPEAQRVKVVAALESVDYVFLFSERRNQANIEALKPDLYIKAGDYAEEGLTSADLVTSYGGGIKIIPIEEDVSTSALIRRISGKGEEKEEIVEEEGAVHFRAHDMKESPAVFIDRDGTINEEILYLNEPEKFKMLPYVLEGIKKFMDMGYRIVIVTNQPGIGFGYYTKEDFYRVNHRMLSELSGAGILVDRIYFCPHTKAQQCECRKPNQALILRAKTDLHLSLEKCYFIGDRTSDIEAGHRAGMKSILVKTGAQGGDGEYPVKPDYIASHILDAAEWVLRKERGGSAKRSGSRKMSH